MSRWSSRIPQTTRARVQVENYLLSLRCPGYSFATVLRLARLMELREVEPGWVYEKLEALQVAHLTNPVLDEMAQRQQARKAEAHRRRVTKELRPTIGLGDYVAGVELPVEEPLPADWWTGFRP